MNFYTHPTYYEMIRLMFSSFPKGKKLNILDFGCGSGYLLKILPKKQLKNYSGFDISKSAIEAGKKNGTFKGASFHFIRDIGKLDLGIANSFDVIVAIGVLQYMNSENIKDFLKEAKRVLRKNGILLISTVVDHFIYRAINFYSLFLWNKFVNRSELIKDIKSSGLKVEYQNEKGLLIGPLVSHNLTIIPDALDKIFIGTKGTLGFFGITFRRLVTPIMALEHLVPLDWGYTLYIKARKIQ